MGRRDDRPHPETRFDRVTSGSVAWGSGRVETCDIHGWIPDGDVRDVVPHPDPDDPSRLEEAGYTSWAERNGH